MSLAPDFQFVNTTLLMLFYEQTKIGEEYEQELPT
jgi:hypothetical protein